MNSTTGDFSEIRKSKISDDLYKRGALSTAKKKSKRSIILRPLNLMDIKKEIEEELEDNQKQLTSPKVNLNNVEQEKLAVIREEDLASLQAPNTLLKDVTNHTGAQPLRALFVDNEEHLIEKPEDTLNLSSKASYRSQVKENIIHKEQKNDSFDLDFSALTLSTPVRQNNDNRSYSLSIIKPKQTREHFQQFVTPKVNAALSRNFSSKQSFLKTPVNSSTKKLVTPLKSEKISPTVLENQNEDKRNSSTFPNYPIDKIVTPSHGIQMKLSHTGLPNNNEEIRCPNPINPLRDDTFKRMKVNDVEYIMFNLLGKGGSSEVYQCYNLESKLHVAIKCVSLQNPASANGYINEVKLLQKLQNCDKIIKMYDYEILEIQKKLLVVLEIGGKDLSTILKQLASQKSHIPMYMLLFYWMDMLHAVREIHSNGIIHSDLKPANFLRGDEGLKLIDFGIASSVQTDMTSVIKTKQEGSCNYISPEALNSDCTNFSNTNTDKYKIHYKSDVWSLGCILYQFVYRRTPFQHITQLWPKLAAIMNPEHEIDYPPVDSVSPKIIGTIKKCLQYNVKLRPSVDELIAEYDCILHNI